MKVVTVEKRRIRTRNNRRPIENDFLAFTDFVLSFFFFFSGPDCFAASLGARRAAKQERGREELKICKRRFK